jgi:hypothetical protein
MHRAQQFILLIGPFILVDGHRIKSFSAALRCNRNLTILACLENFGHTRRVIIEILAHARSSQKNRKCRTAKWSWIAIVEMIRSIDNFAHLDYFCINLFMTMLTDISLGMQDHSLGSSPGSPMVARDECWQNFWRRRIWHEAFRFRTIYFLLDVDVKKGCRMYHTAVFCRTSFEPSPQEPVLPSTIPSRFQNAVTPSVPSSYPRHHFPEFGSLDASCPEQNGP